MNIQDIGKIGEAILREYFKLKSADIFQADWIIKIDDEYRLIEAKYQEIYEPPPFYGHGLPPRQVKARIEFFHKTGIKPYLYVVEKSDYQKQAHYHLIWYQSLIVLEAGPHIDTRFNPRRIYNITRFEKEYYPILVNSPSYSLIESNRRQKEVFP